MVKVLPNLGGEYSNQSRLLRRRHAKSNAMVKRREIKSQKRRLSRMALPLNRKR